MPNFRHLDDHTVVDLAMTDGTIKISTEDYDEPSVPGALYFYNVKDLTVENAPATDLIPYYNEGEILGLTTREDQAVVVIQWDRYQPRQSVTKAYKFSFDGMTFEGSAMPPVQKPD